MNHLAEGVVLRTTSRACIVSCGASSCLLCKNSWRWWLSPLATNLIATLNSHSLLTSTSIFLLNYMEKKNSSQENKKSTKPLQIIVVEKHNEKASRATSHAITIRAAQNSRVMILVSQVGLTTSQYDMINFEKIRIEFER